MSYEEKEGFCGRCHRRLVVKKKEGMRLIGSHPWQCSVCGSKLVTAEPRRVRRIELERRKAEVSDGEPLPANWPEQY